jgi:hypothetical protein
MYVDYQVGLFTIQMPGRSAQNSRSVTIRTTFAKPLRNIYETFARGAPTGAYWWRGRGVFTVGCYFWPYQHVGAMFFALIVDGSAVHCLVRPVSTRAFYRDEIIRGGNFHIEEGF